MKLKVKVKVKVKQGEKKVRVIMRKELTVEGCLKFTLKIQPKLKVVRILLLLGQLKLVLF